MRTVEYEIRSFTEEYDRNPYVEDVWDSGRGLPIFGGMTFIINAKVYRFPPGVALN